MLIISFCYGRCEIEQRCTTCDTNDNRHMECLHHAQGIKARGTLICDRIATDVRTLVEIMDYRCVAATRTDNGMTNAMTNEQRS